MKLNQFKQMKLLHLKKIAYLEEVIEFKNKAKLEMINEIKDLQMQNTSLADLVTDLRFKNSNKKKIKQKAMNLTQLLKHHKIQKQQNDKLQNSQIMHMKQVIEKLQQELLKAKNFKQKLEGIISSANAKLA